VAQAEWRGPLPPPAVLQGFEEIVPGSAARIIDEFQAEAAHRRRLEDKQARFVQRDTHVGQALAIVFALGAFALAGYAVSQGANWVAVVLGGGVIAAGVLAFIKGRDGS
jgi:uncharacterized membrane protein